jgi:hypothetical protein
MCTFAHYFPVPITYSRLLAISAWPTFGGLLVDCRDVEMLFSTKEHVGRTG